jgi:predicted acylesterase/phospholipase RssA
VAETLVQAGVRPAVVAGASSGSVIATGMAAGLGRELPSLWSRFGGRSIVSFRRALWNRSIFDMSHLLRHGLRDHLGDGDLRAAPAEALVTVTRFPSLRSQVLSSRRVTDMVEVVLGSCFLPFLYGRPVWLDGGLVVDGGLIDNLPVEALAQAGCRDIIAVVTREHGRAMKNPWTRAWLPSASGARVRVIAPSRPLEIGSWDFDAGRMRAAVDEGRRATEKFLSELGQDPLQGG